MAVRDDELFELQRLDDPRRVWLEPVPDLPVDHDPLGTGRDPAFLRRATPALETFVRYYDPHVRGIDALPEKGPFLLVGNHSGGAIAPDLPILLTAWWRERGYDEPVYALFHRAFIGIPGVGSAMHRAGGIEADPATAERALRRGASVVVFPGGDHDVFRPASERDRIDFAGRTGWVKLALRTGVPIVPVVSCGIHDSVHVVSRGESLVRWLPHLRLMRLKVYPISIGLPWGVGVGLPTLPLPTRSITDVGPPIHLGMGADAADDEVAVADVYDKVSGEMQATMDRLAAELRG